VSVTSVTVDVEGDWETDALRGVDEVLPRLLDGFDARGVRATLFVVGTVARARPRALREAIARGHTLGAHGMTHRAFSTLTARERNTELGDTRALLEDTAGVPCTAFRAPFFDLPEDMGPSLESAGYRWSSSKAPFSPVAGYRHLGATEPHTLPGSTVREFPVPRVLGLPIPEGLSYRRLFWPATAAARDPPRVFYLHPYELLDAPVGKDSEKLGRIRGALMTVRSGRWAEDHLWDWLDGWKARGAVFAPPVEPPGELS